VPHMCPCGGAFRERYTAVLPVANLQPMSCSPEPPRFDVERTLELSAPPDEVWSELVSGEWLGDDVQIDARPGGALRVDEKIGVIEEADAMRRLAFWWSERDGRTPPSRVDMELVPFGAGTRLRIRESQVRAQHERFGMFGRQQLSAPHQFFATRSRSLARA
jgi:uncharacterized protein YndB with AHSA1/START domain